GSGGTEGALGGAGVSNAATTVTLTNSGTIGGGKGGFGGSTGGLGGAGVSNGGTIVTLSNGGKILGGNGGDAQSGIGGAGGAGVSNSGTILALANSGLIEGDKGGTGPKGGGATGDAIYSAGMHASIGPITNSGRIIGNVEIDNQASVTVRGGAGTTFGQWTGGTITIGAGNLTFAAGNTTLGDNIAVDGGAGTVTNKDPLRIAAPLTITGNFTQAPTGVLGLDFAADVWGQYGALTVTKLTTLHGGLAIDLTNGFMLATDDTFDILAFGGLSGNFASLALDGAACMARPKDSW